MKIQKKMLLVALSGDFNSSGASRTNYYEALERKYGMTANLANYPYSYHRLLKGGMWQREQFSF